ncbi:PAS domain-containing sensor histidine kinase [Methanobacterium sp.]|uniref:PAS domain-containing sensor histidine kinase n=1 Tax=Methanobacterium sp. TaxID=2164 RepID=UPI003C75FDA9
MKFNTKNSIFKEIFDKSPVGIFCYDKKGNLIHANPTALEITGISSLDDFKKFNLFEHPQIASKKDELLNKGLIRFQSQFNFDKVKNIGYYNPKRSGVFYIDYTVSVIDSIFLVQIQDITENKKADELIRDTKEKYDLLFKSVREGFALYKGIYDENDRLYDIFVLEINPAGAAFYGVKREDQIGKTWRQVWSDIPESVFDIYRQVDESGKPSRFEHFSPITNKWYTSNLYKIGKDKFSLTFFDITKSKEAEEELRGSLVSKSKILNILKESEAQYRSIIDNIQDAYFRGDKKGKIIMASPSAAQMYGYDSPEEMIGLPVRSLYKSKKERDLVLKELKKHDKIVDNEIEGVKRDGTLFWVSQNAQFYYDNNDQIQGSEAFIRDITERKKLEKELRESLNQAKKLAKKLKISNEELQIANKEVKQSQKLLQDIIDGYPSIIFVKDLEGRFIIINNELEKLLGVSNEELKGKTDYDIFSKEEAEYYRAHDMVVLEEGRSIPIEEEADLIDGHHTFLANKFPIYDINGKSYGVGSISTDITEIKRLQNELKQAHDHLEEQVKERTKELELAYNSLKTSSKENKRLTNLLEISEQPFAIAYPDGHIGYVNKAFEDLVGYTKDELKTINWSLVLTPFKYREIENKKLEELKHTDKPIKYEKEYIRKDGTNVSVELLTHVLRDKNGEILYYYGFVTDLTERKEVENRLKEIISELGRSNKELESFAYITSHDLQEPLRTIASYAQLIERRYKGKLDQDADEFIGFIVDGAKRMKEMIQGLLDYSRVGTRGNKFTEFKAQNALNRALNDLGIVISKANAEVTNDELPVIFADESQIIRVFQNLIGNALKFRKEGVKPKIHVSAEKKEKEYIFSVSDNGIGLEEQYSNQIFEVFKRLHAIGEYQGTGVGLAIVKRIVDRHSGRVWVESKLGKGSIFYFTLPCKNKAI